MVLNEISRISTVYGIEKRIVTEGQPDTAWTNGDYTSACRTKLTGLESGKTYQFKFRAIGNKGLVSEWSAAQEVLVSWWGYEKWMRNAVGIAYR